MIAHNLSLASELAELLEFFGRSGINAMPFKGPAWTKVLYGNLAYRQIRDLDIFVDQSEMARTCELLGQRGYIHTEPSQAKPIDQCKDIELENPETGIHLELHWSACEPWHDRMVSRLKLWNAASTTLPVEPADAITIGGKCFFPAGDPRSETSLGVSEMALRHRRNASRVPGASVVRHSD